MTKKERTIKACRELAAKYRKPEGEIFFLDKTCSLCTLHRTFHYCKGCPLSNERGELGCFHFASCKRARCVATERLFHMQSKVRHKDLKYIASAFNIRAAFFDKIIPILEGIPASRFTTKGWKYFDMLDRSW